jgi:uncharacterized cupredoxin-like copper-binding protein
MHSPTVLATALLVGLAAQAQAAVTTVNVTMQDSTSAANVSGMALTVDHSAVRAGTVRFHVVNQSKSIVHEMIVVRLKSAADTMPMTAKADRIDEKKIQHLGEVGNLRPGKAGNLQLALKAGAYLLICNEPGHFNQGMKTPFTVTP